MGLPEALFPSEICLYFTHERCVERHRSWNETEGRAHHPFVMQEETIQLITLISFDHVSRVSGIVPIKRLLCMMRGDKPATPFHQSKEGDSYLTLHFSLSSFLSLCVPLIPPSPPPPPPLPYNMMVNLLPGNLLRDVVHTSVKPKRKKENLRHDMMTYPGGMFHCSLGLMGEGSQPSVFVCVCASSI